MSLTKSMEMEKEILEREKVREKKRKGFSLSIIKILYANKLINY